MKEDTFLCALRGGDLTSAVCSIQEGGDNQPSSEVPWLQAKLLQVGLANRARGVGWMPEFKDLLSSLKVCPSVCLSALPRAYNVCYGCWVYEESGCTTLATTEVVECEHRKGLYVLEQRLFEGLLTEMFVCLKRQYEKLGFQRDIEFSDVGSAAGFGLFDWLSSAGDGLGGFFCGAGECSTGAGTCWRRSTWFEPLAGVQ